MYIPGLFIILVYALPTMARKKSFIGGYVLSVTGFILLGIGIACYLDKLYGVQEVWPSFPRPALGLFSVARSVPEVHAFFRVEFWSVFCLCNCSAMRWVSSTQ